MPRVESVEFNGITFRRYPDAKQRSDRVYFVPGGSYRKRGVGRLHEEVWKSAHGPIPDGCHIHHIDGDPGNNAVSNLECLTPGEHLREHWTPERAERQREHLDAIRHLAAEWHGSPEGRAWHSEHAARSILSVEPVEHTCEQCGAGYVTRPKSINRFCSNACKSAWRRKSGVDDVDRECVVCEATFRVNKYSHAKTCSRACGWRSQSRTKRGLQPVG